MKSKLFCIIMTIAMICMLPGCLDTRNKTMISEIIEGQWSICAFGETKIEENGEIKFKRGECEDIGSIVIQDGLYKFQTKLNEDEVSLGRMHFLFEHPEGEVLIDYYDGVESHDEYRNYTGNRSLGVMSFNSSTNVFSDSSFFVVFDEPNGSLYLSQPHAFFPKWGVWKHIDD